MMPVLVSWGSCNKSPQTETTEMYSLMMQQVRHLKPGCHQGWFPLVTSEEESVHCFYPSFQCHRWCFAFLGLWLHHSNLCLHCPRALPVSVCLSPRAAVIGFRAHPDPVFLHLNLMTSAKTQFLFFFPHCVTCGILVPDQGLNPCLLHWEYRDLPTGPPGKRAPPISKLAHIHR